MAKQQNEGLIQHLVGVRYRVTGEGNLKTRILSLNESRIESLIDTPLETATPRLPFRLANFRSQGMQVEFSISEIDETFLLSRIVAYIKPSATGYPQ